ncbi:MAG: hypothetical protein IH586_06525 [Anaerolineaceae bacterium]|nr:hypothetical protein [Anaerolineaceae bacterium]
MVKQPLVENTQSPAYEPTEIAGTVGTLAPIKPTGVADQATPTGEGPASPPAEMQVPDGWRVIDDSLRGYSLALPPEWNVCQETRYSWTFCDSQEDPAWMGFPLRLYISVFPNDYTNSDWEVYNFIPTATIREFIALPIGEIKSKVPASPRPEYFSYTRLPDQMVAESTAAVIENSKLWGIPSGTKERVAFMVTGDTTYILGMYYETPDQLALFAQVLDSFQFAH